MEIVQRRTIRRYFNKPLHIIEVMVFNTRRQNSGTEFTTVIKSSKTKAGGSLFFFRFVYVPDSIDSYLRPFIVLSLTARVLSGKAPTNEMPL